MHKEISTAIAFLGRIFSILSVNRLKRILTDSLKSLQLEVHQLTFFFFGSRHIISHHKIQKHWKISYNMWPFVMSYSSPSHKHQPTCKLISIHKPSMSKYFFHQYTHFVYDFFYYNLMLTLMMYITPVNQDLMINLRIWALLYWSSA